MAYVKNIWVDREGQVRYHETIDDDGALIFTPDYEKVTEIGTPVNADNMNHIEDGIGEHEERITNLENNNAAANFLNKTQITNCITEIPQRIKLELNNGTLTLKAGSEIYYDGAYFVTEQDYSYTAPTSFPTSTFIIAVDVFSGDLAQAELNNTGSYSAHEGTNYKMWFNTTDSKCYLNDGSGGYGQVSYPIAIVNCTNGTGFTAIPQVFNGFGYIGSTIWVDKGVKGLAPDGRNEDGSLRNVEYVTPNIMIRTFSDTTTNNDLGINVTEGNIAQHNGYKLNSDNFLYYSTGAKVMGHIIVWGKCNRTNGVISNFNPKQPFRAVDYNDVLTATMGKSGNGYCKFSNGLIIQWGQTPSFSGTTTVTLPTPFTSTNYRPLACGVASGDYDANWDVRNYTTTSFQINQPSSGAKTIAWHAIGY
jgi:hypothetical protein